MAEVEDLAQKVGEALRGEPTIRHFCNRMTETGTLKRVVKAFDWQLKKKGYEPIGGQALDASLVPAPKQRRRTPARWTLKVGGKLR